MLFENMNKSSAFNFEAYLIKKIKARKLLERHNVVVIILASSYLS